MDELRELGFQLIMLEEHIVLGPNDYYVVVDGDHIGNAAATPLLHNDVETAMAVSKLIHAGQALINWWTLHNGGRSLIDGGDNSLLIVPRTADLEGLRKAYHTKTGFTLSVGTGATTEEADKALVVAKWRGRDQIANFDSQTAKDFQQASAEASDALKLKAEIGESEEVGLEADPWAGAAEGVEISGYDWNTLMKISKNQPVESTDPSVQWLQEIGLVMFSPSSRSPLLTGLGQQYVGI